MWEYKCSHTNKDGSVCKCPVKWAVWCFEWEGERFSSATWVEACGRHIFNARSIVAIQETRPTTKVLTSGKRKR